jgi:methyl-accepting chemotaxis protein
VDFKLNSINKKFLIPTLTLTFVLLCILGLIMAMNSRASIRSLMDSKGNAVADFITEFSADYFAIFDFSDFENFVKALEGDPEVEYAIFYNPDNEPLTDISEVPEDTSDLIIYNRDILDEEGNPLGRLELGYNKHGLTRNLRSNMFIVTIGTLLAITFLSLGIMLLIKKIITQRVRDTVFMLKDIAEGEGDLTKRLREDKDDELGELAKWFNTFIRNIEKIISTLKASLKEVTSSSHMLEETSSNQSVVSSQQSTSANEISSTMEELSASSTMIANQSNSVSSIAEKTYDDIKKSMETYETFLSKMSEIYENNQKIINEILDLGKKSKEISKVMEIINNIADQTKLIAFNAAIEASSAGESGKRFSVVASEIRRLADNVMESTSEIEKKINEIQSATNSLVISSEKGSKGLQEGMDHSMHTKQLMTSIVAGADSTSKAAKKINLSAEQQRTANDQVVVAIREIAEGSSKSVDSIKQITTITKSLTELSDSLRGIIENFKIGGDGSQP